MNSVHEENETVESHVHGHAQLSESNGFQPTLKSKNKEYLAYNDGQELKETKEDIRHSRAMLEKAEKKTIEGFLSLIEDLEQPEKDLVIESSNKTIGSYEFNDDNLNVFTGIVEDNPSYGNVLSEAESYLVRHNEEDVKHKYTMLEEDDKEMILLENHLEKSESYYAWKP